MKPCMIALMLLVAACCRPLKAGAQSNEVIQLILNFEKLNQLKKILQNMYDGYRVVTTGYNKVKDIASGNYKLHQVFLDGLMAVSPEVRNYRRVADIIGSQLALVREYRAAFSQFRNSGVFGQADIDYLGRVYGNLFNQSIRNLDELMMIVTASKLRMTDDERLTAIDRIYADMEKKLVFLRRFNSRTRVLQLQRHHEKESNRRIMDLYRVSGGGETNR